LGQQVRGEAVLRWSHRRHLAGDRASPLQPAEDLGRAIGADCLADCEAGELDTIRGAGGLQIEATEACLILGQLSHPGSDLAPGAAGVAELEGGL
jgi:hypothetical protein